MRIRRILAAGLLLTLASAACARNTDDGAKVASAQAGKVTPSSSSSEGAAANDQEAALKFARCMRQHGMSWFPDPQQNGRLNIKTPKGLDNDKMQKAQEACNKYAPNGGLPPKMSAEELARARQMAQCMREHGVPNFPDPKPDGGMMLDTRKLGTGPGQPTFDKAQQACSKFQPNRPSEHSEAGGGTDGAKAKPA